MNIIGVPAAVSDEIWSGTRYGERRASECDLGQAASGK